MVAVELNASQEDDLSTSPITNMSELSVDLANSEGNIDSFTSTETTFSDNINTYETSLEEPIVEISGLHNMTIDSSISNVDNSYITNDDTIMYENFEEGYTQEQVNLEGGIQILYNIDGSSSTHEFVTNFDSSTSEIVLAKSPEGLYNAIDKDGNIVFELGAPWATDRNGNFIESSYIIDGNKLTQVVSPQIESAYPLTADPLICFPGSDTINNTKTGYKYPTLSVYPQECARRYITTYWVLGPSGLMAFAASSMAKDMWNEVMTEPSIKKGGAAYPYRARLKDQFICHAVNPITTWKKSWNLDVDRPDVSLLGTYYAKCNPEYPKK